MHLELAGKEILADSVLTKSVAVNNLLSKQKPKIFKQNQCILPDDRAKYYKDYLIK